MWQEAHADGCAEAAAAADGMPSSRPAPAEAASSSAAAAAAEDPDREFTSPDDVREPVPPFEKAPASSMWGWE